ncbi:mannosyltransferase [Coemansia sp. RSA 1813]|nr:mannosyltransferase [Coemansia sp. RSA 1813]
MDLRRRGATSSDQTQKSRPAKAVAILVLGDIGHSPRMQYHAISLARAGHKVELVGYEGSRPMEQVLVSPNITVRHIRALPRPTSAPRAIFYLYAPIKVICQVFMLMWMLLATMPKLDCMIVQKSISDFQPQWPLLRSANEDNVGNAETLLTWQCTDGTVEMRKDRPMLIVSSTSWTADEDFSILLDALARYDRVATELGDISNGVNKQLPRLAVLITGKGPLRTYYEQEIRKLKLRKVHIATAWLSAEDYPLVLGSADLGVSLHTSSSGLDLPMKVVDMLGCGTPVCAYAFSCIGELVTADNGVVFGDAEELAQQIQGLASQLDDEHGMYGRLLQGAARFHEIDWDSNYEKILDLLQ